MAIDRLKTRLWVQAQVRICSKKNIPIYVLRSGDQDAGALILKITGRGGLCRLYSQIRGLSGEISWTRAGARERMTEADTGPYLERQKNIDPDIWIIEIEDPENRYELDGPLL
ncbi:MAG: DUF1491 family protein [Pseudomonadota bacterium]|nr:DUF1491 family protein [Pseudomonadota bacterium]